MKGWFVRWIVSAIALYLTALLAQSLNLGIKATDALSVFLAVVVLAVVNVLIRPLVLMLTLPLTCLTLGLFTVVVNALMFWLVGSGILHGFRVTSFWAALFGSIVMGVIAGVMNSLLASSRNDS